MIQEQENLDLQRIREIMEKRLIFSCSETTTKRYIQSITKFLSCVKKMHPSKEDIIDNINSLKSLGLSGGYLRFYFFTIKKYFEIFEYKWEFGIQEMPNTSHPNRTLISKDTAKELLKISKSNKRDYAIFRVALLSGMRRGELVNLKVEDYNPPKLYIKTLKRGLPRSLTLDQETIDAINNYLLSRRDKNNFLFEIYSTNRLSQLFRKYANKLKLPKYFGWHSIRRSLVTWLYEGGMKELEIQNYMGWRDSSALLTYVKMSNNYLQDKVKQIHPIF